MQHFIGKILGGIIGRKLTFAGNIKDTHTHTRLIFGDHTKRQKKIALGL
jgi:hypothetical protein